MSETDPCREAFDEMLLELIDKAGTTYDSDVIIPNVAVEEAYKKWQAAWDRDPKPLKWPMERKIALRDEYFADKKLTLKTLAERNGISITFMNRLIKEAGEPGAK